MKVHPYPIDLEEFYERLPNKQLIKKLLDDFFVSYPQFVVELNQSIEEGDPEKIKFSAHKLKGVLGNLSITNAYYLYFCLQKM